MCFFGCFGDLCVVQHADMIGTCTGAPLRWTKRRRLTPDSACWASITMATGQWGAGGGLGRSARGAYRKMGSVGPLAMEKQWGAVPSGKAGRSCGVPSLCRAPGLELVPGYERVYLVGIERSFEGDQRMRLMQEQQEDILDSWEKEDIQWGVDESLAELAELSRTAGLQVVPPVPASPHPPASAIEGRWRAGARGASEGKGPQRLPQRRLGRRLEEVAEAVGGGYCRLQMALRLALAARGTVAGYGLGALEGGYLPPFQCIPGGGGFLLLLLLTIHHARGPVALTHAGPAEFAPPPPPPLDACPHPRAQQTANETNPLPSLTAVAHAVWVVCWGRVKAQQARPTAGHALRCPGSTALVGLRGGPWRGRAGMHQKGTGPRGSPRGG